MKTKTTMLKAILKKLKELVNTTKNILKKLLKVEKPVGNNMASWPIMGWDDWYLLNTAELTDWLTWTTTNITSNFYTSHTQTVSSWTYQVWHNRGILLPDYASNWRRVCSTSHNTAVDEYWNSYSLVALPGWDYEWWFDRSRRMNTNEVYSLEVDAFRYAFSNFWVDNVSMWAPWKGNKEKLRNFMKLVVWEITPEEHNKIEKQICGEENQSWCYKPFSVND